MGLPYEWKRDIEERTNGSNIHSLYGFKALLNLRLSAIERAKNRGDKSSYDERVKKLNRSLKDGYEKGFLSYIYTFEGDWGGKKILM